MDKKLFLSELKQKMENTLKVFENDLKGLRTGRASVNLLDPVGVEVYGDRMNLSQLATVSTPDARTIVVQVWDKSNVKAIEKAIVDANLGLNPATDGQLIRLPVPSLTEERRKEFVKLAHKYGENSKVSIRNVRRDGIDNLKKFEKNSEISKDETHTITEEVQKLTDDFTNKIDTIVKAKEIEILNI